MQAVDQSRRGQKLAIRAAVTVAALAFGVRGALTARQVNQNNSWFQAHSAGELAALLPGGIDVGMRDRTGSTALDLAIARGDADAVRLLLEHGANPRQLTRTGGTPLTAALRQLGVPAPTGGDPVTGDPNGIGPANVAATLSVTLGPPGGGFQRDRQERREIVRLLLEHGADPNHSTSRSTALQLAAATGDPEVVRAMLDRGADPRSRDANRGSALITLASTNFGVRRHGDAMAACKLLLERGADVNASRDGGVTALSLAARRRDLELVRLLLGHGAKPSLADAALTGDAPRLRSLLAAAGPGDYTRADLNSALMSAARNGHTEAARVLLERGADPNGSSRGVGNPLFLAAAGGRLDVVKLLLQHGARTHGMAAEFVPLGACLLGTEPPSRELVHLLVNAGAPVDTRIHGWSYLLLAVKDGRVDAARMLVEEGADVNASAPVGDPAIVLAAALGRGEIVRLLLDHGADPTAVGRHGKTARERAHNAEIQKLLAAAEARYARANSPR